MREIRKLAKPKELFTPKELKALLKVASPPMRAMVLLGVNGGFGQMDFATLPASVVDFKKGVIDYTRQKTGVKRVVPLWPETVSALRAYRRPSDAHPELFFVTTHGNPWIHEKAKEDAGGRLTGTTHVDSVSLEFKKACNAAGVNPRGPYSLRHTFRTHADATGDQNAIKVIMGQSFPGIDQFYLHLRGPEGWSRIKRVSDYVRTWAIGKGKKHR
jgi:integrase